jgi:hypothetical protein
MFHPDPPTNPLLAIMQALQSRMQRPAPQGSDENPFQLEPEHAARYLLYRPHLARAPEPPFLQSSFVQDTLHSLIGGAPRLMQSDLLMSLINTVNNLPGSDYRGSKAIGFAVPFANAVGVPQGFVDPHTYTHEAGHIADFRNSLPLDPIAKQYFSEYRRSRPNEYGATNPAEYKAEVFSYALELVRTAGSVAGDFSPEEGGAWIEKRLQEYAMPGLRETIAAILDSPVFVEHPLRARFARHQLPAMQAQPPQR